MAEIGNAPLIPSLARVAGFDVVHLHYPFIFGSELTLLGRISRPRRRQALLVHYKNRLVGKGARGVAFAAYEQTVAPFLVGAADRICVLSRGPCSLGPVSAADRRERSGQADRDAERRRHRAVLAGAGPDRPAGLAGDRRGRHRGRLRRDPRSRPPLQAARPGDRGDREPRRSGSTSWSREAASCSTTSAPRRSPPGSARGSISSAASPTPSSLTCCGRPISSCSRPSRRSRSGSS